MYIEVVLYTTPFCHLCDEAYALLNAWHKGAAQEFSVAIRKYDISDNDELLAKYGLRIPVAQISAFCSANSRQASLLELMFWPFTEHSSHSFVKMWRAAFYRALYKSYKPGLI